ncbi:Fn3-like domain-containing protein [Eubacterium uniforme]|uniref:Fn3-like domain-containing protein n=1 Tax=Eubacterium uniforme TaxID=39495 RepID=A0A1T4W1Q0_9FIRM|nr:Fn3-like domain-containing protein [Eubacterium uniforme]SKA70651.1 Fn3-like domain-containing protein [Eubacterium uniforme]
MKKKLLCMALSMVVLVGNMDTGIGVYALDNENQNNESENLSRDNREVLKKALLNIGDYYNENEKLIKSFCMDYELSDEIDKIIESDDEIAVLSYDAGASNTDTANVSLEKAFNEGKLLLSSAFEKKANRFGKYELKSYADSEYVTAIAGINEVLSEDFEIANNSLSCKPDCLVDDKEDESFRDSLNHVKKLLEEKREQVNGKLSSEEILSYINNCLLNTSQVEYDGEIPYSVRKQGAGVINDEAFLESKVCASVNGKAKVELGEVSSKEDDTLVEIELKNYGDVDVTYELKDCPLYMANENDEKLKTCKDGKITSFKDSVTVPAFSSAKVTMLIQTPELEDCYVEGFIEFDGDFDLSIPILMYKGNFGKRKLIDFDNSYFMDKYGNRLGLYTRRKNGEYEDYYSNDYIALSPNGLYGEIRPVIKSDRKIREVNVSIKGKNINNDLGSYDVNGSIPIGFKTKYYDEKRMAYCDYPDGNYQYVINSRASKNDDFEKATFNVVIDSVAPVVNLNIKDSKLEITAYDNNMIYPYFTMCSNGKIKKINLLSDCRNTSGKYYYNLNADEKNVECFFMDMAGNAVYKAEKTDDSSELLLCDDFDLSEYDLEKTTIKNINLKSYSVLTKDEVDSGKFIIKGQIVGKIPDSFKINNKNVEITKTDLEHVYDFKVRVFVKNGINTYSVLLKNGEESNIFTIKGVIYSDGLSLSVDKGLANAIGVVRVSKKKYTYDVNINPTIGIYDLYVNNEHVYSNRDIKDSSEKKLTQEYEFLNNDTKIFNVKVVDICGNEAEYSFKVKYVKITKMGVKVISINQADVYYENTYVYTGKAICPTVQLVCKGMSLSKDDDYTIRYQDNVNIGIGKIIIEGVDSYNGTLIKEFKIFPKKTRIKSVTTKLDKKGYVKIKLKKRTGGVKYQVQFSRKKRSGYSDLKKTSSLSFKTKKLKPGKTYYIKVRCYKRVQGDTFYGEYGPIKKVKIKVVRMKKVSKKKVIGKKNKKSNKK